MLDEILPSETLQNLPFFGVWKTMHIFTAFPFGKFGIHFIKHKLPIYEVCLFLKRIFYWIRHVDHARIFLPSLAALKSEISSWRKKIRRAKHSCVELFLNKFIGTTILKNTNLIRIFKYYTRTSLCNSTFVFRYTTIYCIPIGAKLAGAAGAGAPVVFSVS